jgi:DNA-binding NtrC family response regulator
MAQNDNNSGNDTAASSKPLARIMIVDDESDITSIMKRYFEVQNFAVEAFTDPVKALEHFKQNSEDYSLVISDIRMPGISGIELSKEIKKIAPKVKVILMSSFEIPPPEFSKVNASNMIVDDFMQKPVGLKALLNKVTKQLGHKGEEEREC